MQGEPRDRVQEQRLAERRAAPRAPLEVDRRLHRDEGQRHELREAARTRLLLARAEEMSRPVHRPLDVPEHDRDVRAQPDPVRGAVHLEPLVGRDLVRADHRPHLVVEDLGRGAGERSEAEVAQSGEVGLEIEPERRRALPDLERRERVHVHLGNGPLDRRHDARVVVARERRVDAALKAYLGRPALPRLAHPPDDLLLGNEIRRAAQVRRELALRERAESAAEVADVRVLDVARDDVGDLVAAHLAAQCVRRREDPLALPAPRGEEPNELLLPELVADEIHRRRIASDDEGHRHGLARRPSVLAREAVGVCRPQDRGSDRRRRPNGQGRRRAPGRAAGAAPARARASGMPRAAARPRATEPRG